MVGLKPGAHGFAPLTPRQQRVVLARRDAAGRDCRGCQPLPPRMLVLDRDHVRQTGAEDADDYPAGGGPRTISVRGS